MAALVTLTGNVNSLIGGTVSVYKAMLVSNIPLKEALLDKTTKKFHLGAIPVDVNDTTGAFTVPDLVSTAATDLNIEANTLQYRLVVQYNDGSSRMQEYDSGFFELPASANMAELDLDSPAVSAGWRSDFRGEMESLRDEAVAIAAGDIAETVIRLVPLSFTPYPSVEAAEIAYGEGVFDEGAIILIDVDA